MIGGATDNCIFCQIVAGMSPCHSIWEDECHLAFLSIYPNTPGFTVVVTKAHHPSYLFDLEPATLQRLTLAAREVGRLLDRSLEGVGRTGAIMEGFGVNHAHIKLFPMHGTRGPWRPIKSSVDKYFETYEGYLSSHDGRRGDDRELAEMAAHIRSRNSRQR